MRSMAKSMGTFEKHEEPTTRGAGWRHARAEGVSPDTSTTYVYIYIYIYIGQGCCGACENAGPTATLRVVQF